MEARQVRTAADARKIVKERGLSHVKVGVHDIDGILRGKYIHIDKFHSALEGGMGFCDVVLGWDANDQLYDNVTYTGWHTAYPDAMVRLLPQTCREIATEPGNLLFLCEFVDRAEELCPRGVLRRVLARAAKMGFEVKVGFEYEFFVFAFKGGGQHQLEVEVPPAAQDDLHARLESRVVFCNRLLCRIGQPETGVDVFRSHQQVVCGRRNHLPHRLTCLHFHREIVFVERDCGFLSRDRPLAIRPGNIHGRGAPLFARKFLREGVRRIKAKHRRRDAKNAEPTQKSCVAHKSLRNLDELGVSAVNSFSEERHNDVLTILNRVFQSFF